jgi:hypothetical protein
MDPIDVSMYSLAAAVEQFLNLHSPARRLLLHDELNIGECARYDLDAGDTAILLKRKHTETGGIEACEFGTETFPQEYKGLEHNELLLPTYNHVIYFRTGTNEKDTVKAAYEVCQCFFQYEKDVFMALLDRLPESQRLRGELNAAGLNEGMRILEQKEIQVAYAVMNKATRKMLEDKNVKVENGRLGDADIIDFEHPKLENKVFFLAYKEYLGTFCERQRMVSMWNLSDRSLMYYEPGFFIRDAYATVLEFTAPTASPEPTERTPTLAACPSITAVRTS